MKKLMIVAAAAALAASAQAGIAVTNCHKVVNTECPNIVFKVTASGKIVDGATKEYKTVQKLKVSKGALVLWSTGSGDDCCYDLYSLYLPVKIGKTTHKLLIAQEALDCWTIFGKNLAATEDSYSKNKKFKLDSEIGLSYDNINGSPNEDAYLLDDDEYNTTVDPLLFVATAVGKATYKYAAATVPKNQCQTCGVESYDVVPVSYSGWFAGFYPAEGDELCLTCSCNDLDVYGGTWKAKYDSSKSVKAGWTKAASYAFGSSTLAAMKDEGIE